MSEVRPLEKWATRSTQYASSITLLMFYVYILQSKKDEGTYTGFCENISARLNRHNNGQVKATKHRKPFRLIYFEEISSLAEAKKRERYWKSGGGRRKLAKFFKRGFPLNSPNINYS